MRMTTSFTGSRGVRYPAPDVARGFMLLLIAVANVPSWNKMPNGAEPPVSSVDGWWMFVRTLVVDHRAYPLFAMLFGFGLMTMINRRIASGTQTYLASLPGAPEGREPMPHEAAWAREMATIDAYRLVRRRGWWMLLIGFVHGLVFPGDIIGAYGLVAVLLANLLARKNYSVLYLIAGIISVLALATYLASGTLSGGDTLTASGEQSVSLTVALLWVVTNALQWAVVLVVQVLIALIVPAAVIGARLADTDLLTHPERHRRLLPGRFGAGGARGVPRRADARDDGAALAVGLRHDGVLRPGRRLRLAGAAGSVCRWAQAGWPADGPALAGVRRRPPFHDRLPEPDDPVRHHLRRRSTPGDGQAPVDGAGRGRPYRPGCLAGERGPVRRPGARWSCRTLRDPATHGRRPQRAQEADAAAPARRLARDAGGTVADDADGDSPGSAGADAAGHAASGSAGSPAGGTGPTVHAACAAAGTAAGPLSRPAPGPSAGRMAGRQAPPFGGHDLGA